MQQTSGMVTPGSGGGGTATAPGLDAPEGAAALHHPDQAQLEADKRSVYKWAFANYILITNSNWSHI